MDNFKKERNLIDVFLIFFVLFLQFIYYLTLYDKLDKYIKLCIICRFLKIIYKSIQIVMVHKKEKDNMKNMNITVFIKVSYSRI